MPVIFTLKHFKSTLLSDTKCHKRNQIQCYARGNGNFIESYSHVKFLFVPLIWKFFQNSHKNSNAKRAHPFLLHSFVPHYNNIAVHSNNNRNEIHCNLMLISSLFIFRFCLHDIFCVQCSQIIPLLLLSQWKSLHSTHWLFYLHIRILF